MKARKFYEALSGYGDQYEMLGYFDPNIYDIIELDNGISSDFLILLPMRKWEKVYPVKEAMQRGQIGNFLVSAHDNWLLERYRIGTVASDCCGYIRGHFGSGPLRSDWVSLSNTSPAPKATKELEGFLLTLQTEGFLKSIKGMEEYCGIRNWASLPGEEKKVFGFHCSATEYHYFLRFDANEDSSYNVYIFCYPLRN